MRLVRMSETMTDITKRDEILSVLDNESGDVVDGNNYRGWGKTTEILLKLLEEDSALALTAKYRVNVNYRRMKVLSEEYGYSHSEFMNAKRRLYSSAYDLRGMYSDISILLDDVAEEQYYFLKNRTLYRLRGFVNY